MFYHIINYHSLSFATCVLSVSVMFGRLILVDTCSSVLLVLIAAWCPLRECTAVYLFISYSWKCRFGLTFFFFFLAITNNSGVDTLS